jgi:hypothetical protein
MMMFWSRWRCSATSANGRCRTSSDRVRFETSSGSYFLLLPSNASSRAAWKCGSTLFAIPCAGDPTKVSSVLELLVLTPAARMLRIASLTSHGGVLRVQLLLYRAVGGPQRNQR